MAKQKITTSWNVSYVSNDTQSHDTIMSVNMNWENQDIEAIKKNLNTWLVAIGIPLQTTDKK